MESQWPGVSIILCVHNEAENVHANLHTWLCQDYPCYEVILVNNCSQDSTREQIEDYMLRDERVRLTQIPPNAWNTNVRRLALTLGAKAAHYEHLIFVNPDCRPGSAQWLRTMMTPFMEDSRIEAVFGMSGYYHTGTLLNLWCRMVLRLDEGRTLLAQWLRHPRRGMCRNYACTKALYLRSLTDDHVYWPWNTRIVNDRRARIWSDCAKTIYEWFNYKYRYRNGRKKIGY